MRSYEIYTRKFSQVIQADDIHIAAHLFYLENPNEEIITIENIEARNEALSSTQPVEEKDDINPESGKPYFSNISPDKFNKKL